MQKSVAFVYTNDEESKKKIKKTILLTTASERIKYLGINSAKEVRTYTENDGVSRKEIKADRHEGKTFLVYGPKDKIVTMPSPPKVIYRVHSSPIKIPRAFPAEGDQTMF